MKCEIKIVLESSASNKAKGNCFEHLVRNLLAIHQYEIRGNVNFSGMEIDLVAEHKHTRENLYVECKAKEKVSSDELSKFVFNVGFKKVDKGYFFRTQELESQAGGLLSEIRERSEYKNLTFFEPNQIVGMLSDAQMIFEPHDELAKYLISKKVLAVTWMGDYFIYLINESNALPTKYIVVDAKQNNRNVTDDVIELLKASINEISNLERITNYATYRQQPTEKTEVQIESISEVQESENWFDYLPASSEKNHFVGRDEIRGNILSYFKHIRDSKTFKRIFYLNGKSGWGKSSLVLELKGRCGNKHYKRKFYAIAIDTRSATSDNFVALSFKKLINKAIEDRFIKKDMFQKDVVFTSNVDLLSSDSVMSLLEILHQEKKFLVLIFDQFEDVFRKKDFFKTFYKFLTDVTDKRPNLIIGFSWKSDFFIQSDDPSYHIWQQAKEQAREFTVDEFGGREIDGIIKQLEGSVGDLDKGIKDRIKESSQGLPWLTKKLCIHIYDQIQSGLAKEDLIESNLNISDLFRKDQERLSANELKAIKLIAKRAFEGNFFDETEVGDIIDTTTITSLLHKRLIIRSGANYNIYWDIYRDYLVKGEIPLIGESYLLRQGVNLCLEVFLLFEDHKEETIESLLEKHPKGIGQETLYNILIELRNLGIVEKQYDYYSVRKDIVATKQGFIDYITTKFQNYTPYLRLKSSNLLKIAKSDVIQTLKSIFKQDFQDNTWDSYAKNLISWFLLSNLELKTRIVEPAKGRGTNTRIKLQVGEKSSIILRGSLREIMEIVPLLITDISSINSRFNRDLLLLGVIDTNKDLTDFGKEIVGKDESNLKSKLRERALQLPKIKQLKEVYSSNPKIKLKQLIQTMPPRYFGGVKESSQIIFAMKALTWVK